MNLAYAVFRFLSAFVYSSIWFGAEAVFYLVLGGARLFLLRNLRYANQNVKRDRKIYRLCGVLLFALNAALIGVVYQIIHHGQTRAYPGLMIYLVAIFAFFCLADAIYDAVSFRKHKNPVYSSIKAIKLANAFVAMFSLQIAMFASFGDGDALLERIMNGITGAVVCTAIFCLAAYMVIKKFK
jgi:hypothetical protein